MKSISDRGILWRTFPVFPRKRVRFNPDVPADFTLFESNEPIFKCLGGYFTHNSYNLLDSFVSYWSELAGRQWLEKFGQNYPGAFKKYQLKDLMEITPILGYGKEDLLGLNNSFFGVIQRLEDYVLIPCMSDLEMRKHPGLKRFSSKELHEVIDKTSRARIKTIYPIRILDPQAKRFT